MSTKTFKLSTIAALVLGATQANAALYQVVEVSANGVENYASVIEASAILPSNDLGCFGATSCAATDYDLAGDTRSSFEGFSYKQEVPFGIDNRFYYVDQDDLETYCDNELGYSTCNVWASNYWYGSNTTTSGVGGLYRERQAWNLKKYESNASGFLESSTISSPDSPSVPAGLSTIADSKNIVVNALDGTTVIGNTSSGYYSNGSSNAAILYRDRGFYDSTLLLPKQGVADIVTQMGRTMAFDSFMFDGHTYAVGSGSVASFNQDDDDKNYIGDLSACVAYTDPATYSNCQNFAFAMKPYVWKVVDSGSGSVGTTATGVAVAPWINENNSVNTSTPNVNDYSAQGSVRSSIVPSSGSYKDVPVLVGYNTYRYSDTFLMQAAVFVPKDTDSTSFTVTEDAWSTVFISNATVRIGSDYIYSNSVAKDINDNMLVIGEAKRYGNKPIEGAANNRLFIADASSGSPSASFFSGGIFFTGAGGEANAINNFNEVVGQIDAETNREVGGKKRRRRGFIYPYSGTGTDTERADIFDNKSWWLDNLTNGGAYSAANNHFRIINASDINDKGVISATALKCSTGEYDSTAHNSYCGAGNDEEKIVAVKLIPIAGAKSSDIVERVAETTTVTRSGGSIGIFALTLLGLISFRRKK